MTSAVLFGTFVIMIILNVPVGIALGISSLATVLLNAELGLGGGYIAPVSYTHLTLPTILLV